MSSGPVGVPSKAADGSAALPADLLYGAALRPPQVLWDGARYRGNALQRVELDAVRALAGVVDAVQHTHFAGVVAVTPLYARQAALALAPVWLGVTPGAGPRMSADARRDDAESDTGSVGYRLRALLPEPPAGAQVVAWSLNGYTRVWLPACAPDTQALIRGELAALLQQQIVTVTVSLLDPCEGDRAQAADQLPAHDGRRGDRHDDRQDVWHPMDVMDAAADAALLSQAVGRPVSVPCFAAAGHELVLEARELRRASAPDATDGPAAAASANEQSQQQAQRPPNPQSADAPQTSLVSAAPWTIRPSLARLLSQPTHAVAAGHATVCGSMPLSSGAQATTPLRASVHELNAAQVFAEESQWHEQALKNGEDPLAWRLLHMPEGRGRDLARQVATRAGLPADGLPASDARAGLLHGTGFATAQVQCVDDTGAARMVWSAWVAEVAVRPDTGQIDVTRVVAGHDSQTLHTAQSAPIHAAIDQQAPWMLESARRLLAGPPAFDDWLSPTSQNADPAESGLAPVLAGQALNHRNPADTVVSQGRLNVDGVETLPAAAAIANAIHNATGVRLRQVPFETESLRRALAGRARARNPLSRGWMWLVAGVAGLAGVAATLWPMKPALPLTAGPDVSLYSMRAIERGRLVAAAGDCMVCHTAPGGKTNAGGLALDTPFGTIYTTNITPDNDTGIGRWSYTAFERAMRQGVHQDGRQLYPAFPYTAYAKLSDADMQALYGYLMSQPAVKAEPPKTQLAFPFNMRPLLAGWNALFHDAIPFTPDPSRSAQWLRGAYLVQGAGHCAACHSPRNKLGAEKTGEHYLAGGEAEGWSAPALNQLAAGPRAWSGDELFQYLRTGYSPRHGVAAGPMAPVIHGLAELPDSDLRAITTYLLDLPTKEAAAATASADAANTQADAPALPPAQPAAVQPVVAPAPKANAQTASQAAATRATQSSSTPAVTLYALQARRANGERVYQSACAACHDAGSGPTLFGARPLLSTNTNLHAATPDNLIQVILHGIQEPADDALGYMPAFRDSLDDRQVADLVGYLRERFAPQEPAWPDPAATIKLLRDFAEQH